MLSDDFQFGEGYIENYDEPYSTSNDKGIDEPSERANEWITVALF